MEEKLVQHRVIRRRVLKESERKPVIMVREQRMMGRGRMLGGRWWNVVHTVPGPRLQYYQGCRAGPLGVTRKVVPPLSLVRRLATL